MRFDIIKASGKKEAFDIQKLSNSLVRAGASREAAEQISEEVASGLTPLMRTREIYRIARKMLRQQNRATGMRYALKKAIFALGPSGYPFERYFGRIMSRAGYKVEVGRTVKGFCVSHEVDVLASNGTEQAIVECKYHSDAGKATDVKVALYLHARFMDIRKVLENGSAANALIPRCWLVTNTRCTSDALQYAQCVDIRIVSWRYPDTGSLETMIEQHKLYPVTILPSARKVDIETLFGKDIIIAQDIADMDEESFLTRSGLEPAVARLVKREADEICPCSQNTK